MFTVVKRLRTHNVNNKTSKAGLAYQQLKLVLLENGKPKIVFDKQRLINTWYKVGKNNWLQKF